LWNIPAAGTIVPNHREALLRYTLWADYLWWPKYSGTCELKCSMHWKSLASTATAFAEMEVRRKAMMEAFAKSSFMDIGEVWAVWCCVDAPYLTPHTEQAVHPGGP